MPSPLIKSFAQKSGKPEKEVDKLFKKAEEIAKEQGHDGEYDYIVGILKRMLKLESLSEKYLGMFEQSKEDALKIAMDAIEKQFGKGTRDAKVAKKMMQDDEKGSRDLIMHHLKALVGFKRRMEKSDDKERAEKFYGKMIKKSNDVINKAKKELKISAKEFKQMQAQAEKEVK